MIEAAIIPLAIAVAFNTVTLIVHIVQINAMHTRVKKLEQKD